MESTGLSEKLELLPALAEVLLVRTGTACVVDSTGLALALAAGPSQAGAWTGVVGLPDVGWMAASELGLDLDRTVAVPDPGEHWLSVTAALVDVVSVVLVSPPSRVSERQASRLAARLRQRGAVLIAIGAWPRASVSLKTVSTRWEGLGSGFGHLQSREVTVQVRLGSTTTREVCWGLPTVDHRVALLSDSIADRQPAAATAMAG